MSKQTLANDLAKSTFCAVALLLSSACDADRSDPDGQGFDTSISSEELLALDFQQTEPGRSTHIGAAIDVEVLHGQAGAALYLDEIEAQLEQLGARDDAEALVEIVALVEEAEAVEDLLVQDNWEETADGLNPGVCGISYVQNYEFAPWFYRFSLEVTTTALANGVGPRPPYDQSGWIKAKAIINPGPGQVKNVTQTDFQDNWLVSHSATASSDSGLHSSDDLQTWRAVSVLTSTYPECTGFSRLKVQGRRSYATAPIIDWITLE